MSLFISDEAIPAITIMTAVFIYSRDHVIVGCVATRESDQDCRVGFIVVAGKWGGLFVLSHRPCLKGFRIPGVSFPRA